MKSEVSLEEIMEYIIEEEIDDVEYAVELIENQKDISWATDEDGNVATFDEIFGDD